MTDKKLTAVAPVRSARDPFTQFRHLASDLDRVFGDWPSMRWPSFRAAESTAGSWSPRIDVLEKGDRLVTRIELPGMKKEDVSVEVADGRLSVSGERKYAHEETKDNFYRSEREYGSFCRVVPLPDGVTLDDVKASFSDGVLEVTVPLPVRAEATVRKVTIEEPAMASKAAA